MMALLVTEVADTVDLVLQHEEDYVDVPAEEEGDGTELMHRFVVFKGSKQNAEDEKAETSDGHAEAVHEAQHLMGDPYEIELQALILALELGTDETARRRAEAIMQRISMVYGLGIMRREEFPFRVVMLESALARFLSKGSLLMRSIKAQEKDEAELAAPVEVVTQVDEEDLDMLREEKLLAEELEAADRRMATRVAASESAPAQGSQDLDTQMELRVLEEQAAKYRQWEQWEMEAALDPPKKRLRQTSVQMQLQGWVAHRSQAQTMQWTLLPGQTLQLEVQMQVYDRDAMEPAQSRTGHQGEGSAEGQGAVGACVPGGDESSTSGTRVTGTTESVDGTTERPAEGSGLQGWSRLNPACAGVIEDSHWVAGLTNCTISSTMLLGLAVRRADLWKATDQKKKRRDDVVRHPSVNSIEVTAGIPD